MLHLSVWQGQKCPGAETANRDKQAAPCVTTEGLRGVQFNLGGSRLSFHAAHHTAGGKTVNSFSEKSSPDDPTARQLRQRAAQRGRCQPIPAPAVHRAGSGVRSCPTAAPMRSPGRKLHPHPDRLKSRSSGLSTRADLPSVRSVGPRQPPILAVSRQVARWSSGEPERQHR